MMETEGLRNEMVITDNEEVNLIVVPEEVSVSELIENDKSPNGVLIGAAIAATGLVAYKYGPKAFNKVKSMFKKEANETLEDKQTRLLAELAEVNEKLTSIDEEN